MFNFDIFVDDDPFFFSDLFQLCAYYSGYYVGLLPGASSPENIVNNIRAAELMRFLSALDEFSDC